MGYRVNHLPPSSKLGPIVGRRELTLHVHHSKTSSSTNKFFKFLKKFNILFSISSQVWSSGHKPCRSASHYATLSPFHVPWSPSSTVTMIFILISLMVVSLKGQERRTCREYLLQSLPMTLPWVAEKGLSSDGSLLSSGSTQKAYASLPCRY